MDINNIISSISVLSEKIFKSIEGEVYDLLDNIILIGPNLLKDEPLNKIFFPKGINGIIVIANSLIIFYTTYYILTRIISMYNGNTVESVYKFIIKLVIIVLLVNNSYDICNEVLNINEVLNNTIDKACVDIAKKEVSFKSLKEEITSIEQLKKDSEISIDTITKNMLSFMSISLLITFAIRYVTVILLSILSPFAFVCLTSNITRGISKSIGKLFFLNLFFQMIIKLLLVIPIIYTDKTSIIYKVVLIGTMYMLYRANSFVREIASNISVPNVKGCG